MRLWARQSPGCGKAGEDCLLGLEPDHQQPRCQARAGGPGTGFSGWGGVLEGGHIKEERTLTQFHSYKTRKNYVIQKLGNRGWGCHRTACAVGIYYSITPNSFIKSF